jgi:hypothetical protein
VLRTTITATLLIVCEGEADIDAWLDGAGTVILTRRLRPGARTRVTSPTRGPWPRADLHEQTWKKA